MYCPPSEYIEAKSAKALAVFWAVRFCMEMKFWQVIFEGNAAQVIDDICSPIPYLSKSGHITESIALDRSSLDICQIYSC